MPIIEAREEVIQLSADTWASVLAQRNKGEVGGKLKLRLLVAQDSNRVIAPILVVELLERLDDLERIPFSHMQVYGIPNNEKLSPRV